LKLISFVTAAGDEPRIGALKDDEIFVDLLAASQFRDGERPHQFRSMLLFIQDWRTALDRAYDVFERATDEHCVPLTSVKLLSPLPVPQQMRDCLGFRGHLANTLNVANQLAGCSEYNERQISMMELSKIKPYWYKCNRFSVCGHDQEIEWPAYSSIIDYEHELAAVIGRRGRGLSGDEAERSIFGYTIFNDLSARDVQSDEMTMFGPTKSKDFDNGNVLGPCIVTCDEFDIGKAVMTCRVNGEIRNVGHASDMDHSFPDLISAISEHETIYPGEIVASGTVTGGSGLDIGRFLEPGDTVELEVAGIGKLRNKIVSAGTAGAVAPVG